MTPVAARAVTIAEPAQLTLTELAAAIRERRLSSVEVTRSLLERVERWQPALNAFVSIEAEDALAAARAADEALARGQARGSLHGVPLAHKDMYYSAGKPAGCGSKVREGWIAPATATAVGRLEAAGSFRLGALHMAEFAYGPTGHNSHLGNACNPWDRGRVTGGSSSGSGAAVAARLVPAALGSDTGGSIRLPAHFCGVTGFKPTNNRVSRANAMPLSFTLDTVGPLAQTAEDCALILATIAGPDPLDPTTAGAPSWNEARAAVSPNGLKIGVPTRFYVDDLEPDVAAALEATIKTLESLGARVSNVDLPDQTLVSAAALVVLAVEATSYHAPWLRTRAADYGPQVRARLENGLAYSAVEYLEALRRRGPALAAHLEALGDVDVVLAPASRAAAPTIAETDVGGGPSAEAVIVALTRFMRPVNYLGLPVLSVPAGQSKQNLPIGMQLIGRPFGDELLAALGVAFQAATDHHTRMPTLP
jgi:aspartyl-tRNA(Asn)/glutamyl-tRNA(Gln) amidotransferase subunit A